MSENDFIDNTLDVTQKYPTEVKPKIMIEEKITERSEIVEAICEVWNLKMKTKKRDQKSRKRSQKNQMKKTEMKQKLENMDENRPRMEWPIAIITEVKRDSDGLVRRIKARRGNSELDKEGKPSKLASVLERPIQKIVVLLENND